MIRRTMIRRTVSALTLSTLALAACHKGPAPDQQPLVTDGVVTTPVTHAASIPCALGGSPSFGSGCSIEKLPGEDGLTLLIHHPDGGFRRLLVTTDGRGVITADGSEQAVVTVIDTGTIQVAVGGDRYRLPATVRGQSLPAPK